MYLKKKCKTVEITEKDIQLEGRIIDNIYVTAGLQQLFITVFKQDNGKECHLMIPSANETLIDSCNSIKGKRCVVGITEYRSCTETRYKLLWLIKNKKGGNVGSKHHYHR